MTLNPGKVKTETVASDGTKTAKNADKNKSSDRELSSFDVQFSIIGKKDDLLDFVSKLNEVSPLMKIELFNTSVVATVDSKSENAKVEDKKTVTEADKDTYMQATLKLLVFYDENSKDLPEIDEVGLIKLTEDEEKFLTDIKNYLFLDERFINADDVIVDAPLGKSNPFMDPVEKIIRTDLNRQGDSSVILKVPSASSSAKAN